MENGHVNEKIAGQEGANSEPDEAVSQSLKELELSPKVDVSKEDQEQSIPSDTAAPEDNEVGISNSQDTVPENSNQSELSKSSLEDSPTSPSSNNEMKRKPSDSLTSPKDKMPKMEIDDVSESKSDDSTEQDKTPAKSEPLKESEQAVSPEPSKPSTDGVEGIYHIKWIFFRGKKCPIITQNVNGPCPLLSIMNVLLLRGKVSLNDNQEVISDDQLMQRVGDAVLNVTPPSNEAELANFEQNVNDAMAILPKLQTGLDVNVKFNNGVTGFEFTSSCIIFDLLGIPLYHGWLCDPQDKELAEAIGTCGYNQLVEKIITHKSDENSALAAQALIAEQFLTDAQSQLTYHGLIELNGHMKDEELAVFFRNNHFNAIYKSKSELLLLVTDQGFLKEPKVVWETLSSIDGDGQFVDDKLITFAGSDPKSTDTSRPSPDPATDAVLLDLKESQIDQDRLLAASLAQEDAGGLLVEGQAKSQLTDEELAKQLQEQENEAVAKAMQAQEDRRAEEEQGRGGAQALPQSSIQADDASHSSGGQRVEQQGRRSNKNCTIL